MRRTTGVDMGATLRSTRSEANLQSMSARHATTAPRGRRTPVPPRLRTPARRRRNPWLLLLLLLLLLPADAVTLAWLPGPALLEQSNHSAAPRRAGLGAEARRLRSAA